MTSQAVCSDQESTEVSTGGCHSHELYSHSCDCTQSTVNDQTGRIGGVNSQSGVKKTVNIQIPMRIGPDYNAVIRSEPVGGVTHARSTYFLMYRLIDLGCSSNIENRCEIMHHLGRGGLEKLLRDTLDT